MIAVGQSRLGKTVLWAGAQDQRFAMVIASCSGEGGAALSRRDYGENLDNMTTRYLYQFSESFARYNKNWNDAAGGRAHAGGADRPAAAAAEHRQRGPLVRSAGRVPGRAGRLAGLRAVRQEGPGRRGAAAAGHAGAARPRLPRAHRPPRHPGHRLEGVPGLRRTPSCAGACRRRPAASGHFGGRKPTTVGDGTGVDTPDGFRRPLSPSMRQTSTVSDSWLPTARCLAPASSAKWRGVLPPVS